MNVAKPNMIYNRPRFAVRTMWTGGILALWDFVIALPKLAKRHKLVDEYYAKHGRFKQQPDPPAERQDT